MFPFYGSAIYLYGTANSSFDVAIDSTISPNLLASDELLFIQENLTQGTHYVNLTARPELNSNQQVVFDYAVVSNLLADGTSTPSPVVYDNMDSAVFEYRGNWTVPPLDEQVPNTTHPSPFHQTSTLGSSVTMNFTAGLAVAVHGPRDWGNWLYNVSLDGVSTQYNGSTMWMIGDALLFYQDGLDPNRTHTLELIDTAGDGTRFTLNSVTVYEQIVTFSSTPIPSIGQYD
ncbi:hypothetical protein AcV7_001202 [Taiwanofungus camphoratus]|nr:hypothetical protein AcV7_001202 [Antrodia cinnamomea]